jgi:hypothetical protein
MTTVWTTAGNLKLQFSRLCYTKAHFSEETPTFIEVKEWA